MILTKGDYQMKPNTMKKLFIIFLSAVIVVISGCSQRRDYGTQFNPETDCQYSYYGSVTSWNKIQSDSGGHYLLHNDYIYTPMLQWKITQTISIFSTMMGTYTIF